MLGIILLILATSVDGFSAGFTYGMRHMRFPAANRALVAAISVLIIGLAMFCGRILGQVFPGFWARLGSGCLLVLLGCWTFLRSLAGKHRSATEQKIWSWHLPSLGLVIQILRRPIAADLDASGSINAREAVWLGLALSLDAFGAGFCASLGARLPFYLPLLVGVGNWLFLSAGIRLGDLCHTERLPKLAFLPGLMLICLGLIRII